MLVLVLLNAVWGSTFPITKDLLGAAPPLGYLAVRFSLGGLLLLALYASRRRAPASSPTGLRGAVILGVLLGVGMAFQAVGQVYTTASKSAFLSALSVPLVPLLARLHGQRLHARQAVVLVLGVTGLGLLTYPGAGAVFNPGDLLTVVCALCFAVYLFESARLVSPGDSLRQSVAQVLTAALVLVLLWAAVRVAPGVIPPLAQLEARPLVLTPRLFAQGLYLILVCTVLAFYVQTWALARLSAVQAALIYALEPVFGSLLALVLLGPAEWPGPRGACGAVLVLLAVAGHELLSLVASRRKGR